MIPFWEHGSIPERNGQNLFFRKLTHPADSKQIKTLILTWLLFNGRMDGRQVAPCVGSLLGFKEDINPAGSKVTLWKEALLHPDIGKEPMRRHRGHLRFGVSSPIFDRGSL